MFEYTGDGSLHYRVFRNCRFGGGFLVRENFHFCNETHASTATVGTRIVATVYNENEIVYTTMSKTKEELNAIKEEVEAVNEKLAELTDEDRIMRDSKITEIYE